MPSSAADCGPTDEAMILESQLLSLNAPALQTFKDFKRWFMSAATPVLWGRDEQLYDDEEDVVALAPVDSDRLNRFLKSYFGWFFGVNNAFQIENFLESRLVYLPERRRKVRFLDMFYFPERRIQRAGAIISVILSAVLLIGAVVCLLLVSKQSVGINVGMIVLFTCLFAGIVGSLTNARRAEIFGSTAA